MNPAEAVEQNVKMSESMRKLWKYSFGFLVVCLIIILLFLGIYQMANSGC